MCHHAGSIRRLMDRDLSSACQMFLIPLALFTLAFAVVAVAHLYLGWTAGFFAKAAG
jgi:hypothetical protein